MSYRLDAGGEGSAMLRRLFGAEPNPVQRPSPPRWSGASDQLSLTGQTLCIGTFVIERWGQRFVSAGEIRIDLAAWPAERWRVVAVHDFRTEDGEPDLGRCRAAVFLAVQAGARWEAPEDAPLECRALAVLAEIDGRTLRVVAA